MYREKLNEKPSFSENLKEKAIYDIPNTELMELRKSDMDRTQYCVPVESFHGEVQGKTTLSHRKEKMQAEALSKENLGKMEG